MRNMVHREFTPAAGRRPRLQRHHWSSATGACEARPGSPALILMARAVHWLSIAGALVALAMAVIWSDFGEGGGYATPLAAAAAAGILFIGGAMCRLLARA